MKIGIVTLFFLVKWDNYGGILQNYALSEVFKEMGCEVETMGFIHEKFPIAIYKRFVRYIYIKYGIYLNIRRLKICRSGVQKTRNDRMENFVRNHLNMKIYWMNKEYRELGTKYDAFFVGSDQVWNPVWAVSKESSQTFFLKFAPPQKRFSYAASFGVDLIPEEKKELFRVGLKEMKRISVRENAGKRIVKELIDREANVDLDPTLLINESRWSDLLKKPENIDLSKPYIIVYFLGDMMSVSDFIKRNKFEKEYNIIYLNNPLLREYYVLDPQEFLYLIKNSCLVLTDSFHASVFSFVFDKPFLVFDRKSDDGDMGSRIQDFLNTTHIQRKRYNSEIFNDIWEHDYSEGRIAVEKLRESSREYIMECLSAI